jgi:photosystem II stability/assembly factor-like uncharacterized protein
MDGGMDWQNQASGTTNDLKAIQFFSPTEGYVVGQSNTIIYTANGGQVWENRNTGANGSFEGVHFPVPNEGWVVGDAGAIFHTMDMGSTWTRESSGVTVGLNDVYFFDPTNGWAVGDGGTILKYEVGGIAERGPAPVARLAAYPNPMTRSGVLRVGGVGPVRASVVSSDGRVVRELGTGTAFRWDVRDGAGRRVAPGVYYYVASGNGRWSAPVVVGR